VELVVLRLESIDVMHGNRQALFGLSMKVEQREFVTLRGVALSCYATSSPGVRTARMTFRARWETIPAPLSRALAVALLTLSGKYSQDQTSKARPFSLPRSIAERSCEASLISTHYGRPDVFKLMVDERVKPSVAAMSNEL